jgi:hypothetical protein
MYLDAHERRIEPELGAGQDGGEGHGRPPAAITSVGRFFERGDAFLELFEALAAAAQDGGLDVEFLARDEIELREAALQHGLEVLLEVAA